MLTETRKCPRGAAWYRSQRRCSFNSPAFAGRLGQAENGNVRLAFAVGNRPAGLRVTVDGRRRRRAEALRGAGKLRGLAVRLERNLAQEKVAQLSLVKRHARTMSRQAVVGQHLQPDRCDVPNIRVKGKIVGDALGDVTAGQHGIVREQRQVRLAAFQLVGAKYCPLDRPCRFAFIPGCEGLIEGLATPLGQRPGDPAVPPAGRRRSAAILRWYAAARIAG